MKKSGGSKGAAPVGGNNQLRIIGGRWRSRRFRFLDATGLRPTPDRVRETLFNWLQFEVPGAHCLDLFAGSGALSFEALSRGAASAVLIERDAAQAQCLRETAAVLEAEHCRVIGADSQQWLLKGLSESRPAAGFDLVFLDPPFHLGLLAPACLRLEEQGALHDQSWVYLETELGWTELALPERFELYRETRAGLVNSFLVRYHAPA